MKTLVQRPVKVCKALSVLAALKAERDLN